jgi:Rhomboid family/Tetratricopeptide repeat
MKIRTPHNNFWDRFPLVSSLIIAASIYMYWGWLLDPNKGSDNSFYNLVVPDLNEIRNGHYLGLLTSSLLQNEIVFLVWGISWIWYFGKTIEKHVNILFYVFLIITSIIFPVLFEILIFEDTGDGLGGLIYALFGFTWIMSVYEPAKWSVSYREKLSAIAFMFLCILVNYTGFYKIGIAGLVGGFIWGVFVGFALGSIKIRIFKIAIPTLVLGAFLIPIFWAPWQVSWLLNEADKDEKQNKFQDAKVFYSKVLNKDTGNQDAKEGLVRILNNEAETYVEQEEYKKAKDDFNQILEIDPDNQAAQDALKIIPSKIK